MNAPRPHPASAPDPRLLFFTGGSALRDLSRRLVAGAHPSIHLVTTFDSGGSSAVLRDALGIPAVGDLRNRMLALADPRTRAEERVANLLGHRLPSEAPPDVLRRELDQSLADAPPEVSPLVERCLAEAPDLDLRHASLGNLFLAGAWLQEGGRLQPALEHLAALLPIRGIVRPVTEQSRHLAARLDDGTVVVGQHRITRGEGIGDGRRVVALFLVTRLDDPTPAATAATPGVAELIGEADLICYPVGSFLTSVLAALLPSGVGDAVASSRAPKVYVPNPVGDAEDRTLSLPERVRMIGEVLRGSASDLAAVLDTVLLDEGTALDDEERKGLMPEGVSVAQARLASAGAAPRYDGSGMLTALRRLARR